MIKKIILNNKYFWLILIIIFLLSRTATWFFPYDSDHWLFYYVGRIWAQGGNLYISAWDHKPPIIFAINALMHILFYDNLIIHRVFFTIISITGAYFFYQLAKQIFSQLFNKNNLFLARLSLILYVFWTNLSQFTNSGNNTENFAILFIILMFFLYIKHHENKKLLYLFASGICWAIIFWLKPNLIILSLPIWTDLIFFNKLTTQKSSTIFHIVKSSLVFILPWILLSSYWFFYFQSKNTFSDFIIASFSFSSRYMASALQGNVSNQLIFIAILLLFLVPFMFFILVYLKNNLRAWVANFYHRIIFFSIISALLFILISGSYYTYYYLVILPFLILATCASLPHLKSNKFSKLISVIFIFSIILNFSISTRQLYNNFWGLAKITSENDCKVANYIKSNTSDTDTILSYTYGATFFQLIKKNSGSRYISASHLLLDERDDYGFGLTDTYIQDIKISKPIYLIFPNPDTHLYYLYTQNKKATDFLLENYKLEKSFKDYSVYKINK